MANQQLNASANAQAEVIINLTPHLATPDQASAGLIDMPEDGGLRAALTEALSFNHQPDQEELLRRARRVVGIMADYAGGMTALQGRKVMLGGFSALMHPPSGSLPEGGNAGGVCLPWSLRVRGPVAARRLRPEDGDLPPWWIHLGELTHPVPTS